MLQLDKPSTRRDLGLFLAEGPKLLQEACRGHHRLREVVYDPERIAQAGWDVPAWQVSSDMLDRLSEAHQGVVGIVEQRVWPETHPDTLLVCDGLADPGNLGSLMRTAWATGVGGVVCLGGVDPFHPKVVRSSAGAVFHLPCWRGELSQLKGYALIGLVPRGGQDLYHLDWPQRWALLVGNEAHGLSPECQSSLTLSCTIPMQAGCESLNAAVSAAVVLFEWRRLARR